MTTLEEMIEAARNLPPEDRRQLQRWLQEQEARDQAEQPHSARLPLRETPQQTMERFRKAMDWIAEHRAEYLGQWVVLIGDQLISHGYDSRQVGEEAKAAGVEVPFLVLVREEPEAFMSGIL